MNWKRSLILAGLMLTVAWTMAQPKLSLDFEVKGLPAGYCRIIGMLGGQNFLVDSMTSTAGKVHYEKPEPIQGGLYYFVFPDQRTFFQFLLDKDQVLRMKTDAADPIKFMTIEGSEDNQLFYQNLQYEANFKTRFDSIEAAIKALPTNSPNLSYLTGQKDKMIADRKAHVAGFAKNYPNSFFTVFKMAGQNPELPTPKKANGTIDTLKQLVMYRNAYFENTDLGDERLIRTPVVPNKLKTYITQLTPQNSDSIIKQADVLIAKARNCPECFKFMVNWIAIQYEKPTFMGGEAVLVHLVDKYFTDDISEKWFPGKPEELAKIRKKVNEMRPSLLGKIGQDLRAKNLNGEYESLYDLKTPIKIVFMYSASCSHCQERAPVMREVYDKWKDKIDVYALCLDDDEVKWRGFVTKYHIEPFHNIFDPKMESRYYYKYHVDITPECYVLDQNNKIVAKDLHPNQLEPVFEKILKGTNK
ncbi:MAG: TlpA disulfide reductase family protein [Bacteroidia bacterium]